MITIIIVIIMIRNIWSASPKVSLGAYKFSTYMHIHISECQDSNTQTYMRTCTLTHSHTHMRTHKHTNIHTHTHIYINTHTHTNTDTQTHTHVCTQACMSASQGSGSK